MTSCPLELEPVSSAFAALSYDARCAGALIVDAVAAALGAELGLPVRLRARALPGEPVAPLGAATLAFEAGGVRVVADVEATLGSALAALLGGWDAPVPAARALLPAERAALELLALVALRGARSEPSCSRAAPLLVRDEAPRRSGLAVVLEVEAGDARGEVRLAIPRRLLDVEAPSAGAPAAAVPDVLVGARWHRGTATLAREDFESIAPGDVVLLDEGAAGEALVFDGGLALAGRVEGDAFTVEDRTMKPLLEWNGGYPITLSIEVARVTVPLRDLAGAIEGGVLPLRIARDGRVTLRAGDSAIGAGELVEVDGALGVRISRWGEQR